MVHLEVEGRRVLPDGVEEVVLDDRRLLQTLAFAGDHVDDLELDVDEVLVRGAFDQVAEVLGREQLELQLALDDRLEARVFDAVGLADHAAGRASVASEHAVVEQRFAVEQLRVDRD